LIKNSEFIFNNTVSILGGRIKVPNGR